MEVGSDPLDAGEDGSEAGSLDSVLIALGISSGVDLEKLGCLETPAASEEKEEGGSDGIISGKQNGGGRKSVRYCDELGKR